MKKVGIIQARMGSSRLKGKVLKEVLGKPLLAYQVERIKRSTLLDEVIVATTDQARDDEIVELCQSLHLPFYRGEEEDVLDRYYKAAKYHRADVIARFTGDCPVIDPQVIDTVMKNYLKQKDAVQYASNTLQRTYPRGMDTEVFSFQALEASHAQAKSKIDREHVTRYITTHSSSFKLFNVTHNKDYSSFRWTVDTREDFALVKNMIEAIYPVLPHFTMEDCIHLLEKKPAWKQINSHIEQKRE
ncbi:cytidylyltransferase domain-containing protein [Halalkalibacillus halophilus]|uniref:cytidylyltransferase domain-containing protein n=1 Tax=Halalkalibacillus halophilus TaxID=392827 RepID=UPI000427E382|nr:glycosyltransferase family protein [Halalkalibacillus halophilus]